MVACSRGSYGLFKAVYVTIETFRAIVVQAKTIRCWSSYQVSHTVNLSRRDETACKVPEAPLESLKDAGGPPSWSCWSASDESGSNISAIATTTGTDYSATPTDFPFCLIFPPQHQMDPSSNFYNYRTALRGATQRSITANSSREKVRKKKPNPSHLNPSSVLRLQLVPVGLRV